MLKFRSSILILIIILSIGCKGDEPVMPTVQEEAFEKLSGEWVLGSGGLVTLNDVDISSNYSGFTLFLGERTYTTTNAGDLFNASGTWEWAGSNANVADQIILDDGKTITIVEISSDLLIFSFTKSDGPVRAGLAGNYIVSLEK